MPFSDILRFHVKHGFHDARRSARCPPSAVVGNVRLTKAPSTRRRCVVIIGLETDNIVKPLATARRVAAPDSDPKSGRSVQTRWTGQKSQIAGHTPTDRTMQRCSGYSPEAHEAVVLLKTRVRDCQPARERRSTVAECRPEMARSTTRYVSMARCPPSDRILGNASASYLRRSLLLKLRLHTCGKPGLASRFRAWIRLTLTAGARKGRDNTSRPSPRDATPPGRVSDVALRTTRQSPPASWVPP